MAKQSKTAIIDAEGAEFSLTVQGRDAGILWGPEPFMQPGSIFLRHLGVLDNYTVAGGLPVGSTATCMRMRLYGTSMLLQKALARDADLLSFDYSYVLPGEKTRRKTHDSGLSIRGFAGTVMAQPRGFCTLELKEPVPNNLPRVVEVIDLRNRTQIETDHGPLRIYKRPAEFTLLEPITQLVDFLKQHRCETLNIRFV